jgi:phi13 family phage major tail protein
MPDVYGELIGCDSMHSAPVTSDTATAYVSGANSYLAPVAEIQHDTKIDTAMRYYDNKIKYVTITEGNTEVKVTISGVPCTLAAILTGKPYDSTKGIFIDTGDASNTPWRTLSGRMDLGDGGYRYFQYLKGKFALGAQKAKTREDKTTINTVDLTFSAVTTEFAFVMPDATVKGIKGLFADTTDAAFDPTNWFTQVQTPSTVNPPAAILLSSSVPANNATAVVATVKPALTFNNVIAEDAVTLVKTLDNSVVPVTKAYDVTGKILTITPTASLTSAGVYDIIVAGVKDIYGQTLASSVIKFTVA